MNGDLISRKAAIEEIYKEKYSLTLDDKANVEEILNDMPTAFEVETVIKELEELRDFKANNFNISKYGLMQMVIEYVKSALNQ